MRRVCARVHLWILASDMVGSQMGIGSDTTEAWMPVAMYGVASFVRR